MRDLRLPDDLPLQWSTAVESLSIAPAPSVLRGPEGTHPLRLCVGTDPDEQKRYINVRPTPQVIDAIVNRANYPFAAMLWLKLERDLLVFGFSVHPRAHYRVATTIPSAAWRGLLENSTLYDPEDAAQWIGGAREARDAD